jgi:hypothetical protein
MAILGRLQYATSELSEDYNRSNWWRNQITNRILALTQRQFDYR